MLRFNSVFSGLSIRQCQRRAANFREGNVEVYLGLRMRNIGAEVTSGRSVINASMPSACSPIVWCTRTTVARLARYCGLFKLRADIVGLA